MIDVIATRVAVLGAGTMGRGIALAVASAGFQVELADLDKAQRDSVAGWAANFLGESVRRGKIGKAAAEETLARIAVCAPADISPGPQILIEALPERLDLKRAVLSNFQTRHGTAGVIHTNTSTLAISDIARDLPDPRRIVGTHYCNPAPIMTLVEVAASGFTTDDVLDYTRDFLVTVGKTPAVLKDRPGLITNFLVVAFENDAVRALEAGLGSPTEIDRIVVDSMGFPIGPFRLLDIVGLDVHIAVSESLRSQLDDDQYEVPKTIRQMASQGHLGRKSGRGFYEYGNV